MGFVEDGEGGMDGGRERGGGGERERDGLRNLLVTRQCQGKKTKRGL